MYDPTSYSRRGKSSSTTANDLRKSFAAFDEADVGPVAVGDPNGGDRGPEAMVSGCSSETFF